LQLLLNSPDGYSVGKGMRPRHGSFHLRCLLTSSSNAGGKYTYLSPGFLKMLRFTSQEEAIGCAALLAHCFLPRLRFSRARFPAGWSC
jgi:hypothetical protein